MKKQLLLCVMLLFVATISAQKSIVDNEIDNANNPKEDALYGVSVPKDSYLPLVSKVVNPNKTGINTTKNCIKLVRTPKAFKLNALQLRFSGETVRKGYAITGNEKVKLLVMSETATTIKLELDLKIGQYIEEKTVVLEPNTWKEVSFDFSPNNPNAIISANAKPWIDNIRIRINKGSKSQGETIYFDEYRVE